MILMTLFTVELCAQVATRWPPAAIRLGAGTPTSRRLVAQAQAERAADDPLRVHGSGRLTWHPRWGWMNRPGVNQEEYTSTVDADGHRDTGSGPRTAAEDSREIVVIGDSFTFGDEVNDDETFAWLLRERAGVRVTNLGTLGYGLDQMLLRLRDHADASHPTTVLLCVDGPVILRNVLSWDVWLRPHFGLDAGRLVEPTLPLPSPADALRDRPWLATADVVSLWREVAYNPIRDEALIADYANALLAALFETIRADGATPLVVWMPMPHEVTPRGGPHPVEHTIMLRAPAVAGAVIDLSDALNPLAAAGTPVQRKVHWTPEAHAAIAASLGDALTERGLIGPTGR